MPTRSTARSISCTSRPPSPATPTATSRSGSSATRPRTSGTSTRGSQVHTHVRYGEPSSTIAEHATDHGTGMIVLGTRGNHGARAGAHRGA
ncbi:MAG: universal stress protein [Sandaracinaceae bacterium]